MCEREREREGEEGILLNTRFYIPVLKKNLSKHHFIGVPVVAQQVTDLTGSMRIPGFTQWVKDPVLLQALLADVAQMWRCCGCGAGRKLQVQNDLSLRNVHISPVWA